MPEKPTLKIGRAYSMCGYNLHDLPIPDIETWIYVGENLLEPDGTESAKYHYFERPEVFFEREILEEHTRFDIGDDVVEKVDEVERHQLPVPEDHFEMYVFDFDGLKEWLAVLGNEPNADKAF